MEYYVSAIILKTLDPKFHLNWFGDKGIVNRFSPYGRTSSNSLMTKPDFFYGLFRSKWNGKNSLAIKLDLLYTTPLWLVWEQVE
jgi:hypothetical protein